MIAENPALRAKLDWVGKITLVVWLVCTLVLLAMLSLNHMASLPQPADEAMLSKAVLRLRKGSSPNFVAHIIYAKCSCAQSLLAHLATRPRFSGAEEVILFVGEDLIKQELAKRAGLPFVKITASQLSSEYGLEAAPVMIVFDSANRISYAGGYYGHPAAVTPLDGKIYSRLEAGLAVEPLPVFGCAVSERLQKSLDPWGLGYFR